MSFVVFYQRPTRFSKSEFSLLHRCVGAVTGANFSTFLESSLHSEVARSGAIMPKSKYMATCVVGLAPNIQMV